MLQINRTVPIFVPMSVAVGIDVGFDSHIVARMTVPSEPTAEPVMEIQKNESKETEFKFYLLICIML